MKTVNSIEKPEVSEIALEMFRYLFYTRRLYLEYHGNKSVLFAQQMKIQRLMSEMKIFIYSKPYTKFRIVVLPQGGIDVENADFSLEIKNFDYFVKGLDPTRIVLIISPTWDSFIPYQETVDKNLMEIKIK